MGGRYVAPFGSPESPSMPRQTAVALCAVAAALLTAAPIPTALAAPTAVEDLERIAVVELQRCLLETAEGKRAKKKLESTFAKGQARREKKQAALQKKLVDLQAKAAMLSEDELLRRQQELAAADQELQQLAMELQQEFGAGHQSTLQINGIEASLTPGANSLRIGISGDNEMPYALDVSYRTRRPVSDDDCVLRLTTELGAGRVKAGSTVPLVAQLANTRNEGQPMSMVILGLPAGLEPRADQLKQLRDAGRFDYYETRAREVILYWRDLAPSEVVDLQLDLVAAVPRKYTGPASRTYLYYTAEQKQWCEPLAIEITRE